MKIDFPETEIDEIIFKKIREVEKENYDLKKQNKALKIDNLKLLKMTERLNRKIWRI